MKFDADRNIVLTEGTRAAVRYLNLVGDRYLDLVDGPGSTKLLPAGGQIPVDRTAPALDLDLLLGGLKPVIQGLNPQDVNALTSSLIAGLPGSRRDSRVAVRQDDVVLECFGRQRSNGAAADRQPQHRGRHDLQGRRHSSPARSIASSSWSAGCPDDRDTIGPAIDALDKGTASLADLLASARPPLAGTVDAAESAGAATRSATRTASTPQSRRRRRTTASWPDSASYGATIPYYLCEFDDPRHGSSGQDGALHSLGQTREGARNPNA